MAISIHRHPWRALAATAVVLFPISSGHRPRWRMLSVAVAYQPGPLSMSPAPSPYALPAAVRPYVIPRVARQQGRVLALQMAMFGGMATGLVAATHIAGASLLGVGVLSVLLFAGLASQDLYLSIVGADGLLLSRRGGECFFVAFTDLLACELQAEGGMVLVVHPGVAVPVLDDPSRHRRGLLTVSMLRKRILAARDHCVGAATAPPVAALLHRGGLSLDQWVQGLRGLAGPDTGAYRTSNVSPSMLWRLAEDGRVAPVDRVAAVVALAPTLDPSVRARLQALWSATANPYLQEAIAAAQDERPNVLREVLDAASRSDALAAEQR